MKRPYYQITDSELEQELLKFMRETTELPDLGLSEFTEHGDTDHIWSDLVSKNRKWAELASLLRSRGWDLAPKSRAIHYVGGGNYETRQTRRWVPPTSKVTQ